MKFAKFFCIALFLSISLFCFAQIAQAGIVSCGLDSNYNNRCTLCDLIVGIRDIIKWGRSILVVVALVAIVAGGIMYIISAGNSGMMESAKNVIKQALWGVVIVLGAWLIVNTVLWLMATNLSNVGISSWSDFDCEGGAGSGASTGGTTTCTSFIYSTWGECQSDSTQSRNVINSSPAGCTGGTPVLTQSCTYTGSGECTSFTYSDWTLCTSALTTQSRIVTGRFPANCTGGNPITSQPCPGTTTPPTTLSEEEARANLSTLSNGNISVWESSPGATNIKDLRQTSVDGVESRPMQEAVVFTSRVLARPGLLSKRA